LSAIQALKLAGAIDNSFGLGGKLREQIEVAQTLRDVQQRLHGAEALVSSFPQLDPFRESQFNQQSRAVQGALRAFGRVKFASIERRFSRIQHRLEIGKPATGWRNKLAARLEKRYRELARSIARFQPEDLDSATALRAAYFKHSDLFQALDGFAVTAGPEARLASRFVESSLSALSETEAVLEGLSADQQDAPSRAPLQPVFAALRARRLHQLEDLGGNAVRLLEYPPSIEVAFRDEPDRDSGEGERELYVLRHAEAVIRGTPGYENDHDRVLTPQGIRSTRKAAAGMRAAGIGFDRILTSPLARARETAAIVAAGAKFDREIVETEALSPDTDPRELFDVLNESFRSARRILIVGHQPELGSLVSMLTAGDLSFSLNFKKGAICKISFSNDVDAGAGSFEWFLTPKLLAKLE
jgi:phosphohistidine phosphatase